jgi:NAD(P)-dependent dehydrogenase (short-subunit alcohol dehydrogenase family)
MQRVHGSVELVIGAGHGIGLGVARRLVDEGRVIGQSPWPAH